MAMRAHSIRRASVVAAGLVLSVTALAIDMDRAAATPESSVASPSRNPRVDRFGVRMLYPTAHDGRVWTLPDDAHAIAGSWQPESDDVVRIGANEFRTDGDAGEVRLSTHSAPGEAWWRNVEMTAYFRYAGERASSSQRPHFELLARGERHTSARTIPFAAINDGVRAPAGTATWPGYPFGARAVDARCLGATYHANVYFDGSVLFEKELSHPGGYAEQRAREVAPELAPPNGTWFGVKFVVRNAAHDTNVRLEAWVDAAADGTWTKATEYEDSAGRWPAESGSLDGCTIAPFSYWRDEVLSWAGPWVTFRSDGMILDFKWLSVREIAPLP